MQTISIFASQSLKKNFALNMLFLGMINSFAFGQSYYVAKDPNSPGSYRKTAHSVSPLSGKDKAMAIQMMDAIVDAVKNAYPQPIGADVGPYGGVWQNYKGTSEFKNGPYIVHMTIPFFELLKTRAGGTEAGGEYSSSIAIWVNSARYILQGNSVKYGNDLVFRLPKPGIPVNGFPKYNNMILVLPPGKPLPWRPATKQEYLENFITGLKNSLPGRSSTPMEKQQIPDAEKLLASMSPAEKKQVAFLRKWNYGNAQTGYPDFGSPKWAGFQDANDTTAEQLVIVDENFYDFNLPRNSFQLVVIERKQPRASISAAIPTPEQLADAKRISERMNVIVRSDGFLSNLQRTLGKSGLDYVTQNKKVSPATGTVVKKPTIRNIDRIVDSLLRNYKETLPPMPAGPVASKGSPPYVALPLPPRHSKKLTLAARKLNTKAEVVQYLNEIDSIVSKIFSGTTIPAYSDANTAVKASYGFWIFQRPRESLLVAIKAAKLEPESNTALNNLGATLSLCGVDYLAIPLYIVCLKKEATNSTLTNNIGQSYLALGDHQQAESYLKKAVSASTYHHHANNSLGQLYLKQGNKEGAIRCFENSLRGSFTLEGYNGLKALKKESVLKLINYVRHRYKQPDYINFDKYPSPPQCLTYDKSKIREAQHRAYQKTIDDQVKKYFKLKELQEPLAAKANQEYFLGERKKTLRPFLPLAWALIVSLWKDHEDKIRELQKDLVELERARIRLKIEFDSTMKGIEDSFEPRLEALGEGNADPTLEEDICEANNSAINTYLPQFAEINEERFRKIIHTHKDYLNDYLYWIRFGSFTEEQYRVEYYDIVLSMLRLLKKVSLTTLHDYCNADPEGESKAANLKIDEADCPLPIGVELPFVVGKIQFDCKSWGLEIGEAIVLDIEHLSGGATTIALGPGVSFYSTPKIGGDAPMDINPGVDAGIKGQAFVTFDANTIIDWGLLFEAEIDVKGVGKPLELKQNITLGVNKGLTAEGPITALIDKALDIPPERQVNKNVPIYRPQQN